MTDWDNGHNTVLRRQPLPALPATVLERLSVRTELGNGNVTTLKKPAQPVANTDISESSAKEEVTQKPEPSHHLHPHSNIRNLATSLTSLTRELTPTISDVYHERNLGLGLAPSLSKLLEEVGGCPVSGNEEQAQIIRNNVGQSQTTNWLQSETELCRRDEADGRSIAESQCSATSSGKPRRKAPPPPL